VDRGMRNYATVIYSKGALRLEQLEGMLGTDHFRKLLATLIQKHIRTTHDFLDELQAESSIEIRLKFEELLKT
jgi:aminopeptidase N